ncbi:hypothetical protein BMS3Abin03_00518 [bacterium BMS3Abin03]|nr:hypothetical protein BMS3Abin03_00518 [bacterium BMS3Abin03]
MLLQFSNVEYKNILYGIPGLKEVVEKYHPKEKPETKLLLMEFVLFGLSEYSLLSRFRLENSMQFKDMLSTMFTMPADDDSPGEDTPLFDE